MTALSPAPIPDEPQRSARWIDETATLTNAQVLELRQVIEQQSEAIDDLKTEATSLRERVRALETCNDEFDRTLEQHDDRLDAVEATVSLTALPSPVPVEPLAIAPVRLVRLMGQSVRNPNLQDLNEALEAIVAGVMTYRRHGVEGDGLIRVLRTVEMISDKRLAEERLRDAAEDAAAEAWLAEGRAS